MSMQGFRKRNTTRRVRLFSASLLALGALPGVSFSQSNSAGAPVRNTTPYNSIAVTRSEPGANGSGFRVRPNNDLEAVNTTLLEIIAFAYNVHPKRIVNAPAWADKIPFDLKLHYAGDGAPDDAACKEMLKQALKEHFGLQMHGGGERLPAYAIHVEQAGTKLARSMEMPGTLPGLQMPAPGKLLAHNASVADLASTLQRSVLDRPVVDESGVMGRWDFELTWAVVPSGTSGKLAETIPPAKSLAEAMQRELGLRLDSTTAAPSDVVLDDVRMPADI